MKKNLVFFVLGLLYTLKVAAQPTHPILRMEMGMHNNASLRLARDAAGKYVLSCSTDKTARLWDAATGQLLNTLRIPIGDSNDGKMYACALSADGTVAAFGGWTGYEWDKLHSIYIVNTQTGALIHRIKGMFEVIDDLQFSPDGKWLAAGLKDDGVHIFDTQGWTEAKKLQGYGSDVYKLSFDKNNRLVVACYDGKIRLYDNHFEPFKAIGDLPGKLVNSVSFNQSGTLIAVGYADSPVVEVRSGDDLSLLYQPAITGAPKNGDFCVLKFSVDGQTLYGGSYFQKQDDFGIWKWALRKWTDAGKGSYTDIPLAHNTIHDIITLPNGNVAVLSAFPDIAVVSAAGKPVWSHMGGNINFSAINKTHFRSNTTGSVIGFTPFHESPLIFDIASRSLTQEALAFPGATDKNGGTVVTNWNETSTPAINKHKVTFMMRYETTMSTDVTKDGKDIILGTGWDMYRADSSAKVTWGKELPGIGWAVKISGNNKVVIVALGDGTIRWYRMSDGKEILAFYLNSDKKRWVLFTPSGYYDASPGAEDLLGWHINNGADKAPSFYPASRFKDQFHRPDIIDAVLETYDEEQAIALANSHSKKPIVANTDIKTKLPPVLTITSPANGTTISSESVSINYAVNTPDNAPVKNIKVLVNGRPVAIERGVKVLQSGNSAINLTVPASDCTITLLAENENGMSPEANLYLKYKAPEKAKDEFVKKPKLYVLAIGISGYQNPDLKLNYAAADATGFTDALVKLKGGLYADVVVKQLIDKNATKDNILDAFEWIQKQTSQQDIAMIFYAGHGVNDNNGLFYMLPVAADLDHLRSTGLNFEELRQTVSNIAGKVVVFIDACHSGNVMGSGRRGVTDVNDLVNELSSTPNGAITFTSSTGREYSLEDASWQHGAFTKALLEGLDGKAAIPGKNKITVKSLDAYVSERVKELTKGNQHPTSVIPPNVPDFPISASQ